MRRTKKAARESEPTPEGSALARLPGRRKPTLLPAELLAPMTGEVEQQLRELVEQFGVKKVHDALVPLIAECKFSDWQCHRDRSYAHRKAAAKAVASMMLVAVLQP